MNNSFGRLFLVALFCAPAFAAPTQTIFEVSTSGGLTPKPVPVYGVRVLSNGAVQQFSGKNVTELARITVQKTAVLRQLAERIDGNLVDLQKGKPFCTDAPSTHYKVVKKNGKSVEFAKLAGCHEFEITSLKGVSIPALKRALNGFSSLGDLRVVKTHAEENLVDLE